MNITSPIDDEVNKTTDCSVSFKDLIIKEGKHVIEKLMSSSDKAETNNNIYDLCFRRVKLSNFGPYGGPDVIEYPLANRGLVLIRGQSTDGTGADSNGSGKVFFK